MAEPARTVPPSPALPDLRAAALAKVRGRMLSPWLMRGFFLAKVPLALAAGVRLTGLDPERATATVPYGWRSTNPFRSTYFAALAMAAELSTGALAMLAVEAAPEPVALLIVGMTASFEKKATATTTFTCAEGGKIFAAVAETLRTGDAATAEVEAVGRMPDGTVAARFTFTWSFKKRSRPAASAAPAGSRG